MTKQAQNEEQRVSGFGDVFDSILDASDGEKLTINEIMEAFGTRAFGPLIFVPALLAILPTGVVPGVPILLGFIIILINGQILIGRSSPWIPRRLREVSVNRDVFKNTWERFRPYFRRVDRFIQPRLTFLTDPPALYVVAILCIALAIVMAPLELIPFAVAIPGTGIAAFGLGIATKDGLIVLLGLIFCGVTTWAVMSLL